MEIKNLKQLKEALNKIPEHYLEQLGIGCTDEGHNLCILEDEYTFADYFKSDDVPDSEQYKSMNANQFWGFAVELYPVIDDLRIYFGKVIECGVADTKQEDLSEGVFIGTDE